MIDLAELARRGELVELAGREQLAELARRRELVDLAVPGKLAWPINLVHRCDLAYLAVPAHRSQLV